MTHGTIDRRRFIGIGLGLTAAASAVALPQLGGIARADSHEGTPESDDMMSGDAMVRVIHASPDAPAVDIFVDGARAIENLAFGEATDYVALPAGEHQVQVAPAGAEATDAVIDATLTLEGGVWYQVAAVGLLAEITAAVFEVDGSEVDDDKARVRVIHASPDAPGVDVAVADGPVLFENIEFPNGTDYAEVDAGTYDLQVRPTGTEDVALDLPGVEFMGGGIYDIFAIGTLADGTLTVLPLTTGMDDDATPEADDMDDMGGEEEDEDEG